MSAADPSPAPHPTPATALQSRLDYLFRHHVRDDPANAGTAALRRYVESYRLGTPAQTEHLP